METIKNFSKLIRINNLIIIAATQVFAYYFLSPSISLAQLFEPNFIALLTLTFLVAAAGYIINDYMDVMLDLVNKPEKVIVGKSISRRWAMFLHLGLNLIAILISYQLSKKLALMVSFCALSLWIYSQLLKKMYLTGNILVALLTAFTIFILIPYDSNVMEAGIMVYGLFAFLSTLQREIIKDTEDLRGDEKFKCKTLPIVLGIRKTKKVIMGFQIILLVLGIFYCVAFTSLSLSGATISRYFLIYMGIAVIGPMFYMVHLIHHSDVKKDFTRLSFIAKIIMVTGILSMCFWRF